MLFEGVVVISHSLIIILAYTSPFWLDWKLVALGVILNEIQLLIFKGCVLSIAQFGIQKSFHIWYLEKMGLKINHGKFNFFMRYITPLILIALALLIQFGFGVKPFVKVSL